MLPVYMLLSTHPPIGPLCTGIVAMLLSAFSYVDTVHVCGEELNHVHFPRVDLLGLITCYILRIICQI